LRHGRKFGNKGHTIVREGGGESLVNRRAGERERRVSLGGGKNRNGREGGAKDMNNKGEKSLQRRDRGGGKINKIKKKGGGKG